jgi:hypothetical protein
MVSVSLLQSCSSVRRVVERNEIYTLVCGEIFLGSRVCFPTRQLTRTALCYCWGRHVQFPGMQRPATWNSWHLETRSYTIISQECPSYKSSKGRTIRFRINPNKHHHSFSSFLLLGRSSLRNINRLEFPQS